MAKVAWRAEFSVGLPAIDSQHRAILRLLNDYFDPADNTPYRVLYDRLIEEIDRHFAFEEGLMAKYAYPGAPAHHQQHLRLRGGLEPYVEGGRNEAQLGVARMQLYRWITEHVMGDAMDRDFAVFLRRKGVYPVATNA